MRWTAPEMTWTEFWRLFHRRWGSDRGDDDAPQSGYDKQEWMRLQAWCLTIQEDAQKMRAALDESVKLQAHYAVSLNTWDGGERIVFKTTDEWLARLDDLNRRRRYE